MSKDLFSDEAAVRLYRAFLSLENQEECKAFLSDLCTISEVKSMSQRLTVAVLLRENKTYSEITEETGVSAATISRVGRALDYGEDGYKLVLNRLEDAAAREEEPQ